RRNGPFNFTLIDVVERKTVAATSAERYVALSYVWGDGNKFKARLDTGTVAQLMQAGYLSKDNEDIPLVIRDAMDMVQAVGLRFLWVDSICITQDDAESQEQIYSMDRIYAGALITIIALSAAHADEALPGVRLGTRQYTSFVETIHDKQLITAFPHVWEVFDSSAYATRGWTFQEQILSNRRLYVTEHQLYWDC
ncbi:heterokaryon incompatibility protein-domain-containing protein, partial [Apiosordaria backusii]